MDDVILRTIKPQDCEWLVENHRLLYAQSDGFDDSFGDLVKKITDDFLMSHDPKVERGWIAERKGHRLGSVFCVRLDDETAQLRLFFLVPEARGTGLGRRMLQHCMTFARHGGYAGMRLWTHRSHRAACALYKAQGSQCIATKPAHSFGRNMIVETYTYRF